MIHEVKEVFNYHTISVNIQQLFTKSELKMRKLFSNVHLALRGSCFDAMTQVII